MSRFDFKTVKNGEYWADAIAAAVIAAHPDAQRYTCAAGISPSGVVHFGNFRDVITSYVVARALRRAGKETRLIFSWDNFDRLRKVPAGVDASFAQYIGMPLSKVPDPTGKTASYAEHFQQPFVEAMRMLGIDLEYIDQTKQYESGAYDAQILHALKHRSEIADILLSFMTEKAKAAQELDEVKYREEFYPISVYSRFTGKDSTTVLSYDGATSITYRCEETKKEETIDLSKDRIAKLGWKIDWPMRWQHEGVTFEPGGHDHASPGGSFDASSVIAEKVFGAAPPTFAEYKFVGIQGLGAKMSGSKGNAVSPKDLLEIYDPVLLTWLYLRKAPDQSFMLAFDTEIFRQYDEFDREAAAYLAGGDGLPGRFLEDSLGAVPKESLANPMPFRQAVGFGQIVQWNETKLVEMLDASGLAYNPASIATRLSRARNWLDDYNPGERIGLLANRDQAYMDSLDEETRDQVSRLKDALAARADHSVQELETLVYDIPKRDGLDEKALRTRQRAFFGHVYRLLVGKDTGPRLGTFLWAIDRKRVLELLGG